MKILKEVSRKYHGKSYFKYKVNLSKSSLDLAEFKEGDELVAKTKKGEIKLIKNRKGL